jgi:hypothetical protein
MRWVAALKVKIQRPEALIAYVRQQNKQGMPVLARRRAAFRALR